MFYIILTLLVGINIAPFIFHRLDIWHAQGLWVQLCLVIAFSCTFFEIPKPLKVKNIALGLLHLWVGIWTAYICYLSQIEGKYNVQNFFPYFNFLCLLIFYQVIVKYISKKQVYTILSFLRYTVIATLFMCVFQSFNIAQFFKLLGDSVEFNNNLVVGFIGNGTHLSGFLASCIPLFLIKINRENILALILLIIVLFHTGTSVGDPSVSGLIIALVIIAYYLCRRNKWFVHLFITIFFICLYFIIEHRELIFYKVLNPQGRLELWGYYWKNFVNGSSITGHGLGRINQLYQLTPFPTARHVHLEYLQFMFELGVIGFVLIMNMIHKFFSPAKDDELQFILKLMVLGFCLSCLFNYPAHLWLPSSWAMAFYAFYYAIENEKQRS